MKIFDLTKNIKLEPQLQKKYAFARILLHVLFLIAALFVADRVLFPIVPLDFSYGSVISLKNTLGIPYLQDNSTPPKGIVAANDKLIFDANPIGRFSTASLSITTDSNSKDLTGTQLTMRKSYKAFFYPLGSPIGFRDGTLLTTSDGNYYIISDGMVRKFASTDIISQFGYSKDAFQTVSSKDLQYNKTGPDITSSNTYPDDTLFAIDDTYYQLKNQQLLPFISQRAFLSQYDSNQAITKDDEFLKNYPQNDSSIGFANGTLASTDQSVFILSNGKSYPISDADTFVSFGFDWNNVITLQPEEIGLYAQQKQFNVFQPHPDGTLFQDVLSNKFFVIENGKKRPIETQAIANNYSKQHAIIANLSSLNQTASCKLKKQLLSEDTYSCNLPLEALNSQIGNDYQIETNFASQTKIKTINTTFFTPFSWQNLKDSLSRFKTNLKSNYSIQ